MRSRELPVCRSHRYATPADSLRLEREDCVVWRAPACPESWFGHRLELDAPTDPEAALARWAHEQSGLDIQRRFVAWETPLSVPLPTLPPRFAPFFGLGLERPPAPLDVPWSPLPLVAATADTLPRVIAAAARQHPQFGSTYLDYVRWLYQGLADRGATVLAAWSDDRVVAAATLVTGPDGDGRFQEVWTDAAWRRRGLASALVAEHVLRAADRTLLLLCEEGSDAHRIYVRAGFRPVSRWVELSVERPA